MYGRSWTLFISFLLSLKPLYSAAASDQSLSSPNFVIIFLDDAGWGDVGINWRATTETKFLDGLAKESLRFTDFHSAASVCTPSRASLLTGRLGLRTDVTNNFKQGSLYGLPTTEITLAEVLHQEKGYKTAMIGKWHLGTHPPHHPTFRGFERYLGVPYSVDMGCADVPGEDLPPRHCCCQGAEACGIKSPPPSCLNAPAVPLYNSTGYNCSQPSSSSSPPTSCNDDIVEQPVNLTTLAKRYSDFAIRFFEEQAQQQQQQQGKKKDPFFLYVAMSHMHVPLAYDPAFENATGNQERRIYGNTLAEADHEIGRIVQALHATGLANDTLVFITSDNGPWDMKCELGGLVGPYEGRYVKEKYRGASGKFTTWEGGHRVPAFAYWPTRIQPGVTSALTSTLDFFPTMTSLAGIKLTSDRSYDGIDLSTLLLAEGQASELSSKRGSKAGHSTLFHPDQLGHLTALRFHEFKVHFKITQAPPCLRETGDTRDQDTILETWQYVVDPEVGAWPLVFDLEEDQAESSPIEITALEAEMLRELVREKMYDIHTTFRSTVDYTRQEDPTGWPCCDASQVDCRCLSSVRGKGRGGCSPQCSAKYEGGEEEEWREVVDEGL